MDCADLVIKIWIDVKSHKVYMPKEDNGDDSEVERVPDVDTVMADENG